MDFVEYHSKNCNGDTIRNQLCFKWDCPSGTQDYDIGQPAYKEQDVYAEKFCETLRTLATQISKDKGCCYYYQLYQRKDLRGTEREYYHCYGQCHNMRYYQEIPGFYLLP